MECEDLEADLRIAPFSWQREKRSQTDPGSSEVHTRASKVDSVVKPTRKPTKLLTWGDLQ
jgi:hypothetical protein